MFHLQARQVQACRKSWRSWGCSWYRQLQVFEVDHPVTQAFKRQRLAELGWAQPAQLHFLPVYFTKENLAADLARVGLRLEESLSPADIERRYFQGRTD